MRARSPVLKGRLSPLIHTWASNVDKEYNYVELRGTKAGATLKDGIAESFVLEPEEMYGEMFDIPEPMETIFLGWFKTGHVFRSGCTWVRGNGKIFYFQPGHETNPSYRNENVQRILKNAVRWACPIKKNLVIDCPYTEPVE